MSAREAVLRIDDVTLRFGGIVAIKSVSFKAQASELLALVGPNGAGKTALLNCISGIYRPTSGNILLDGASIVGQPLHRMVRLGVGRAFQHAELFPHLTVTENLLIGRHSKFRRGRWASGLYLGSTRRDEINERRHVEGIIEFFEIYRHRDTPVGSLPSCAEDCQRGAGPGDGTEAVAAGRAVHRPDPRGAREPGALPVAHPS
jgi:branched-chain amino acid transport system ATP-binding protein